MAAGGVSAVCRSSGKPVVRGNTQHLSRVSSVKLNPDLRACQLKSKTRGEREPGASYHHRRFRIKTTIGDADGGTAPEPAAPCCPPRMVSHIYYQRSAGKAIQVGRRQCTRRRLPGGGVRTIVFDVPFLQALIILTVVGSALPFVCDCLLIGVSMLCACPCSPKGRIFRTRLMFPREVVHPYKDRHLRCPANPP